MVSGSFLVSFLIIPFSSLSCIFSHTFIMIFLFVKQFLFGTLFWPFPSAFWCDSVIHKGDDPLNPSSLFRFLLHAFFSWMCCGDQPLRPCSFHDPSDSFRLILIGWYGSLVLCLGPTGKDFALRSLPFLEFVFANVLYRLFGHSHCLSLFICFPSCPVFSLVSMIWFPTTLLSSFRQHLLHKPKIRTIFMGPLVSHHPRTWFILARILGMSGVFSSTSSGIVRKASLLVFSCNVMVDLRGPISDLPSHPMAKSWSDAVWLHNHSWVFWEG